MSFCFCIGDGEGRACANCPARNQKSDFDMVPEGYWEGLRRALDNAPAIEEEPGDDPEPLL